jgi:hypothetical protein
MLYRQVKCTSVKVITLDSKSVTSSFYVCLCLLLPNVGGHLHLVGGKISFIPNEDAISMITMMGFTRVQSIRALKATDNNVERAADWIFSHQAELDSEDSEGAAVEPAFRDGESSK